MQGGGRITEYVGGTYAAVAALAAVARARVGPVIGEHVDFSLTRGDDHRRRRSYMRSAHTAGSAGHDLSRPPALTRDAVDRADRRRLRRVQHQLPPADLQDFLRADRAPRPARRRRASPGPCRPVACYRDEWNADRATPGHAAPPRSPRSSRRAAALRIPVRAGARTASTVVRPRAPRRARRVRRRHPTGLPAAAPAVPDSTTTDAAAAARRRRGSASTSARIEARTPAGAVGRRAADPARSPLAGDHAFSTSRRGGSVPSCDRRARGARRRRDPRRVGHRTPTACGITGKGLRHRMPSWWEWGHIFAAANTNKLDLTLDLDDPRGHELMVRADRSGPTWSSRTSRRV